MSFLRYHGEIESSWAIRLEFGCNRFLRENKKECSLKDFDFEGTCVRL